MKIVVAAKKYGMGAQTIRSLIKTKEIRGSLAKETVEEPYLHRYVSTCLLFHKPAIKKREAKTQATLVRQHASLQKNIRSMQTELNKLKKASKKIKNARKGR